MGFLHLVLAFLIPSFGMSQVIEQSASYISAVDSALNLRKITVLPVSDNVNGIYARPIEQRLIETLQKNHHWEYVESKIAGPVLSPMELEADPAQVRQLGSSIGADTMISAKATKGPDGITIIVDMFLAADGLLFAQEMLKRYPNTNITDIQEQTGNLLQKVLAHIPFQGMVLSRDGNRVTVNVGSKDGVRSEQVISATQIIKLNRHPKFSFLVSAEKEVLGKIKLEKVDETLSFGIIVTETERGVIHKLSKITGLDSVTYSNDAGFSNTGQGIQGGRSEEEQAADLVAYGKNPKEWVPVRPPSFGRVGIFGGLGSYTMNSTARSPALNMTTSQTPFLNLKLVGEIWITPNFTAEAVLRQGVFSAGNPRKGSSPSDLSFAVSNYDFKFGYNFLILDEFFGPKIQVQAGFSQYYLYVDQTTPTVYTSTLYRGLVIGINGSFPIDQKRIWQMGAGMNLAISPAITETPTSSGSTASNTVSTYKVFGSKRIGERIEMSGALEFELYASEFGGVGTRTETGVSTSQRLTTLWGGVNYLF